MNTDKIKEYIKKNQSEMIKSLGTLVSINSCQSDSKENMPFGEGPRKALDTMLDMAQSEGFFVRNIDNYVGTIDLYEDKAPELGILCHLDVVPEGDGWDTDPYTLTEKNGILTGRGTIDDKGPAIAVLYAMKAIKDCNIPLTKNVRFIVGTNEENGSKDLLYYRKIEKMPHDLFTVDGDYPIINTEKGMMRLEISKSFTDKQHTIDLQAGNVINALPAKASCTLYSVSYDEAEKAIKDSVYAKDVTIEQSANGIVLNVTGKNAHASLPEKGDNAITKLLAVLSTIDLKDEEINKAVHSLSLLFKHGENDGRSLDISCEDDISGKLTSVLSILNVNDKTLSGHIDIRFPVCENCSSILKKFTHCTDSHGFSVKCNMADEPHHVDEKSEFIQNLLSSYTESTGEKGYCMAIGGGTYVHNTEGGVAFGPVFPGDDNHMHGPNEFITTKALIKNTEIIANAIIKICR